MGGATSQAQALHHRVTDREDGRGQRADAIYSALTMSAEERERRATGLKEIVTSRDPGDWIDEQVSDIRKKARGGAAADV